MPVDRGNLRVEHRFAPLANRHALGEQPPLQAPRGGARERDVGDAREQQPHVDAASRGCGDGPYDTAVGKEVAMCDVNALARGRERP
jgi:hypothetical protein